MRILQVSILVGYLPPTVSMPPAFSPCPEPPPQQLQHQLKVGLRDRRNALQNMQNMQNLQDTQGMQNMKVELEDRRDVLPVVFPTMNQLAPLEMFHSPEIPSAGQQGKVPSLVPLPFSCLCLFCIVCKI